MADDSSFFGARRGWSLRRRFWALDSYGLLLLMIMVALVVASIPTQGRENLMAVLRTVVLAGTFLFALHTSDASRWMYYFSIALVVVAVSASVVVDAGTKTGATVDAIAALLIVLGALFVIGRRFAAHPVITGQSVLAALCIYLLFGLGYAAVYGVVGALDNELVVPASAVVVDPPPAAAAIPPMARTAMTLPMMMVLRFMGFFLLVWGRVVGSARWSPVSG